MAVEELGREMRVSGGRERYNTRKDSTPELKRHMLRYLDICASINNRNERRGDERDTAAVYDILFLHLMPSFRGLGLVYPAWLIPMVLRDLSEVYLARNNERHAPINQFFSFSETDR